MQAQDRVTCCFIELPCPDAIRQQGRSDGFFVKMYQQLQNFFGKENGHGGFVHKDEIHDYSDKMTVRAARRTEHHLTG